MKKAIYMVALLLSVTLILTACGSVTTQPTTKAGGTTVATEVPMATDQTSNSAANLSAATTTSGFSQTDSVAFTTGKSAVKKTNTAAQTTKKEKNGRPMGNTTKTTKKTTTETAAATTVYVPRPKNPAVLSDAQTLKIKEDYAAFYQKYVSENLTVQDVYIRAYYGTYNGCEVMMISADALFLMLIGSDQIAGYIFYYPDSQRPEVHVGSTFMGYKEAYDQGILSKQDIHDISCYVNGQ